MPLCSNTVWHGIRPVILTAYQEHGKAGGMLGTYRAVSALSARDASCPRSAPGRFDIKMFQNWSIRWTDAGGVLD
eukprot:COSAG02_NODE_629_length_19328_cov_24.710333_6_plen_75_part_00